MKYKIDADILNMTTKCKEDFSCLSGEDKCLCEVEEMIKTNGRIFFIKPKNNIQNCNYNISNIKDCNYNKISWNSFRCFCPTRIELFNRYKI